MSQVWERWVAVESPKSDAGECSYRIGNNEKHPQAAQKWAAFSSHNSRLRPMRAGIADVWKGQGQALKYARVAELCVHGPVAGNRRTSWDTCADQSLTPPIAAGGIPHGSRSKKSIALYLAEVSGFFDESPENPCQKRNAALEEDDYAGFNQHYQPCELDLI